MGLRCLKHLVRLVQESNRLDEFIRFSELDEALLLQHRSLKNDGMDSGLRQSFKLQSTQSFLHPQQSSWLSLSVAFTERLVGGIP